MSACCEGEMEAAGLNLVLFITAVLTTTASTLDSTCNTCNCQFNNIQVLDQLIDMRIASRINIGELLSKF